MQTATHVKTGTIVGVALLAGAGMAAAVITMSSVSKPALVATVANVPDLSTVRGASDVPFFGVTLSAKNQNLVVTDLTFTAFGDTDGTFTTQEKDVVVQDHLSSCSVYDAASGSLLDGPEPIDASGQFGFHALSIPVRTSTHTNVAVRCEVTNVDVDGGTPDIYAISIPTDTDISVELASNGDAVPADHIGLGGPLDPGLNVTGADVAITVNETGSLTASLDPTTPSDGILLGSAVDVPVAAYTFTASAEDYSIDKLSFTNAGEDSAVSALKVSYKDQAGGVVTKTSFLSGGAVTFSNIGAYVPAGKTSTVTVLATTPAFPVFATSGDTLALSLNADANFDAVGASSGSSITNVGADIPASVFTLRATKPTFTLAAGSPSGAGVPGFNEVLRFNVRADAKGAVEINNILFTSPYTDNAHTGWNQCGDGTTARLADGNKWSLYDTSNPATPISDAGDWSFQDWQGNPCGVNPITMGPAMLDLEADAANGTITVPAGTTKTFSLKLDTTGASAASDDVVKISIFDQGTSMLQYGEDALMWSDGFASLIDGSFIDELPVQGGTIIY